MSLTEEAVRSLLDGPRSNGGATEFAMQKQVHGLTVHVNPWPVSTEPDKWMAEIPALPGCLAWGDTPEEAVDIITNLVADFLPDGSTGDVGPQAGVSPRAA